MAFTLPPLVGFCGVAGRAVFLDARTDRYWLLGQEHARIVERAMEGAPLGAAEAGAVEVLVQAGLLVGEGPVADTATLPPPVDASLLDDARPSLAATVIAWLDFSMAARHLRRHGLEAALRRLSQARDASRRTTCNVEERHVAGSAGLRLLVSATGRCLPLSLALATRCATDNVRLVFGVKLDPFAAHAWVQRDSIVLNDEVHVVRQFTPVLAV